MTDVICGRSIGIVESLRNERGLIMYCVLPAGHSGRHRVTELMPLAELELDVERPNGGSDEELSAPKVEDNGSGSENERSEERSGISEYKPILQLTGVSGTREGILASSGDVSSKGGTE